MMLLEIQRTRRRKLWIVSSLVVLLYACTLDFGVAFLVSRNSNVWKPVRRISEKCNQLIQTNTKIQTKEKSLPKVYSSYDDDGFGDDLENGGEDFEEDMDLTAFANPEEEGAEDGVPLFPEFGTLRKEKKEKFVYQSPMRETNFTDTYLLVGTFPRQLSLAERRNLWVFHMQWVRRTHLLKYIPVEQVESIAAAKCEVAEEFTVLSPDRLSPMAQVMLVKANSSDDVLSYLKKEPFQVMNTIDWQVDTLEEMETYDAEDDRPFELDNDVVSPFLFVSQQKLHVKNEGKFSTLFDNSFEYHNTAATAGLPFAKYGNSSRVSMMFRIRDLKSNKTKGELLVFNAKTHKDALRYLTKDPFAADRDISEKVIPPTVDIKPNSLTIMGPINIQDCDGDNHYHPQNFAEKSALGNVHVYLSEDLLMMNSRLDKVDQKLKFHVQENIDTLKLLAEHNIFTRSRSKDKYTPTRVIPDQALFDSIFQPEAQFEDETSYESELSLQKEAGMENVAAAANSSNKPSTSLLNLNKD